MKLFVAYHYSEEDQWIKQLVIPMLGALDIEINTGEDLQGEVIEGRVRTLIEEADALVAFVTHPWGDRSWVRDELLYSLGRGKRGLIVVNNGLLPLGGLVAGRQYVGFDLDKKEKLLVELVRVLYEWKKTCEVRSLIILPFEIMQYAWRFINENPSQLRCSYRFRNGNQQSALYETIPFPLPQALAVDIKNIPTTGNPLIQLSVKGPGFSFSSGYQDFSYFSVKLEKDPI